MQLVFNPFTNNLDFVGTGGGGGDVTSVTGENGVTASPTTGDVVVSGVLATTSSVGVASFNPDDFTVDVDGEVSSISGSAGIATIDGDSGSVSGSEITIYANNAANNSGSSVAFANSGTISTLNVTDENNNTMIGNLCGNLGLTGNSCSGYGYQVLASNTADSGHCAYGFQALNSANGVSNLTAYGYKALALSVTDQFNTAVGYFCLSALNQGVANGNTGVGYQSLKLSVSCTNNTGVGVNTLLQNNSGTSTALGAYALQTSISDNANVAVGYLCLSVLNGNGSNSNSNSSVGSSSLSLLTSGGGNSTLGTLTLGQLLTGSNNLALGSNAGLNCTSSESNNIFLNNSGVVSDSNTMRIGEGTGTGTKQLSKAFIAGINGNTVSNTLMVTIDSTTDQLGTATIPTGIYPWSDISGTVTALANNGYFITGTTTSTLPASPTEGDSVRYIVDTASILTIQAAGSQKIRIGSTLSASGGTAVNTLRGDSIELVYRSTGTSWFAANSPVGIFNIT